MSPDEQRPIAENEVPEEVEQDAPLTKEAFAAQIQRLAERARAAGFNPIRAMAQTYAKQGLAIVEGLLVALENENNSKKKKA